MLPRCWRLYTDKERRCKAGQESAGKPPDTHDVIRQGLAGFDGAAVIVRR